MSSPSTKASSENDQPVSAEDATAYRALVARANYLAQDRADIAYAVKELCRNMSSPKTSDWDKLKRFGRYLLNKARVITKFPYQENADAVDAYVDTDFAGCPRTRRSTSGGAILLGCHCIKTWSANQQVVALSSGEAEYYGMVKGGSNALGIRGIVSDLGVQASVRLHTDSSAAKGISNRRGLGKVRHIELSELWL